MIIAFRYILPNSSQSLLAVSLRPQRQETAPSSLGRHPQTPPFVSQSGIRGSYTENAKLVFAR